ncbi:MAG: peptide MFS transporter [Planctomycetota bacterium]
MATEAPGASIEDGQTWLGHPRGLFILFFAELWERFCYYGMRALLVLYLVQQFAKPQSEASVYYGSFTALVYALGVFGGSIADKVLGYRRSIMLGGILMAIGEFILMVPSEKMFLAGLGVMVVGNGLFKPNISTLVGKLYKQGDVRRDGGFTIFYMGINIGAFLAPIACQWISAKMGTPSSGEPNTAGYVAGIADYRYGFMLAGIGMLFGILVFGMGAKHLHGQGLPPQGREGFGTTLKVLGGCVLTVPVIYLLMSRSQITGYILLALGAGIAVYLTAFALRSETAVRQRIFALLILLFCNIAFWASFEQAGNSLNFFAKNHIRDLAVGEWVMPFEWFQSVNAIFIVLLGPLFAALWVWLERAKLNPSIPLKFGLALIQVGLGFGLLMLGIQGADAQGEIPWFILTGLYLIHTTAELCISPVGLSMVTKLAPTQITGLVMGAWFLSISLANFGAGLFSKIAGEANVSAEGGPAALQGYVSAFTPILWMTLGLGVLLALASPLVNKLMHGVK